MKNAKNFTKLLAIGMLILLSNCDDGNEPPISFDATVSGQVVNEKDTSEPIADIAVSIRQGGEVVASPRTGADGRYSQTITVKGEELYSLALDPS